MRQLVTPISFPVARLVRLTLFALLLSASSLYAQFPGWPASSEEAQKDTLVLTNHRLGSAASGTYSILHSRSLSGGDTDTLGRYLGLYSNFQYLPESQRFFTTADLTGGFYYIDRNLQHREAVEFSNAPGGETYFFGVRQIVTDNQGEHFFFYQRNVPRGLNGFFYMGINDSVHTEVYNNVQEPMDMILDHSNLALYMLLNNNNGTIIRYTHDTGVIDTLNVAPSRVMAMDFHAESGTLFYYNDGRFYRSNVNDLAQREEIIRAASFSDAGPFTFTKMHYDHNQNRLFVAFRVNSHLNQAFEIRLDETPEVTTLNLPNHGFVQSMVYFEDTNSLVSLGAGMTNLSTGNIFLEYDFDSGVTHVPGSNQAEVMVFDRASGYVYQIEQTHSRTAYLITRMYPDGSARELVAWMPMNSMANRYLSTIRIDETGRRLLYLWINGAGNEYIGSINLNDIHDRGVVHEFETDGPRMIASFDYDEVNDMFYYLHLDEGFYKCDASFDRCNLHWARGNDTYSQFTDLDNAYPNILMKVVPESNHLFFNVHGVGIRYVNLDNAQEAALLRTTFDNATMRNLQYNPDLQLLTMYEQIGFQRTLRGFSLPNAETAVDERFDTGNQLSSGLVVVFDPSVLVSIDDALVTTLPTEIMLGQNYPNPFNPTTRIPFTLQESGNVTLEVYDVTGRKVATLMNGMLPAGTHTVSFDARDLSSGLYLYRLSTGSSVEARMMTLIK
ncbi:MAG: T9SS type A sorting domain-containing protein [Balneolales bacterium]|nr:T9SS type A sorting domain-containing protein [Balneolales bacterium]